MGYCTDMNNQIQNAARLLFPHSPCYRSPLTGFSRTDLSIYCGRILNGGRGCGNVGMWGCGDVVRSKGVCFWEWPVKGHAGDVFREHLGTELCALYTLLLTL